MRKGVREFLKLKVAVSKSWSGPPACLKRFEGQGPMKTPRRILTLDSNVFIAALKADEPFSEECAQIISRV